MDNQHPILITGAPRSGASMIAGIINLLGVQGGALNKMNENVVAYELHSAIISSHYHADPSGQYPLPRITEVKPVEQWDVIVDSVFKPHEQWFYKDSRMSLTWPNWNAMYPNARWIVVRRNMDDIVNSCIKTKYMTAFNDPQTLMAIGAETPEEGWRWWASQYQERFLEMSYTVRYMNTVWVERMALGDFTEMKRLVEWLGLQWNPAVEQYMNEKLKNSPQKKGIR